MTSELYVLVADLNEPERRRVMAALAADPELADGVAVLIAELPRRVQERVILRLAIRLMAAPLGRGALIAALTDVIVERMQRDGA